MIDYATFSRDELIAECRLLRESLHSLGKEATTTQRRKMRLEDSIVKFLLKRSITSNLPAPLQKLLHVTRIKDLPRIFRAHRLKV